MSLKRSLLSVDMSLWRGLRGRHVAVGEPAGRGHVAVAGSVGINMSLERSLPGLDLSLWRGLRGVNMSL